MKCRKMIISVLLMLVCICFGFSVACGEGNSVDSLESLQSFSQSSDMQSEASSFNEDSKSAEDSESVEDSESTEDSESVEPELPKPIAQYVDFVVDVEEGRDIRVLQLTDVQTISCAQKRYPTRVGSKAPADTFMGYERYIGQVIENYDPDFIIMTGDNTYGEFDDCGEQFLSLISFMDSFEIPWAPVFGNHDNESNMGVDWQCEQFENSPYCLFKQRELTGNGNYSVGLTQGGELKRVFYMLDSNGCSAMSAISYANGHSKTSVGFGDDQIEWYSQNMEELSAAYPQTKLSMAFHVQIAAFEKAMAQYGYNASTIRANPINLDMNEKAKASGDFGYIGRAAKGPWDQNDVVWNTILKYGVDSVFVGHEHCNSVSIEYQGVRLTYGQKSSTFDRYNLLQADGSIRDSSATSAGTPIMGGTYIQLSERDGSIADAGLYLYDAKQGYEKPSGEGKEEENTKITIDNIPETATVKEFDFNGTDFNTAVTTAGIKGGAAKDVSSEQGVPDGFTNGVYGYTTNNLACVGINFPQKINADRLLAVFVRMYVGDYTVTAGKTPLLRIYNDVSNAILCEKAYSSLGGENETWCYVDILQMLRLSKGIVNNGELAPFSLLYRFYGATEGSVYFDSITFVADGDMYEFPQETDPENVEIIRGGECYLYSLHDFSDAVGVLSGTQTRFIVIDKNSYSLKFTLEPSIFAGQLYIYGYTTAQKPNLGIGISLSSSSVGLGAVGCPNVSYSFEKGKTYEIKVGFVKLFNGNTVYTFLEVNGELISWALVECYGKVAGNIVIQSSNDKNSFVLS